jgi:hypothetical protein
MTIWYILCKNLATLCTTIRKYKKNGTSKYTRKISKTGVKKTQAQLVRWAPTYVLTIKIQNTKIFIGDSWELLFGTF